MKVFLTCVFLVFGGIAFAQKPYKCTFLDSSFMKWGDSSIKNMAANFVDQGIPEEAALKMAKQVAIQPVYGVRKRMVYATADSTIINIDGTNIKGNLTEGNGEGVKLLYQNDRLYKSLSGRFGDTAIAPMRIFKASGYRKKILEYLCQEYISEDQQARIFITTKLPSYVNPGIRTGDVKGAVLAFELEVGPRKLKSELTKIK